MGRTKKRSAGRKPVWQTRRGGRQPGARGPEAKDGFSELERAYLKVHRNAKGLTNQEIAERAVEAVLGGKRGADPDRLEAIASLVLPDQSVADLYLDFSPWLGRTTGGGSSGERIVGQEGPDGQDPPASTMPPKAADNPQPPVLDPRHVVGFDGLMFSGKVRDPSSLIHFFQQLVRSCSDNYEFHLPTPSGPRHFVLSRSRETYLPGIKRPRKGYQTVYNIGLVLDHLPVPQIILVARLYVGSTRSKCPSHRWVQGSHRSWACLEHQAGGTCPPHHYEHHPRRCGQCGFSDRDFWKCPACAKPNGQGCPECDRRTRDKPDLFIEITGKGCQHQVHVPLVQHLFSRFVDPATVVRQACDIALDVELPWASTLPVQDKDLMTGNQRPFTSSRTVRNNDGEAPPGLYLGDRFRAYGKHEEVRNRQDEGMDLAATLPGHMADWEHSSRLEFTFGGKYKSQPGQAGDLSTLPKDWNTCILADLSRLQPGTIEHALAWEAKLFGFTYHKASRKRIQAAFKKFENPKLGKRNPGSPYELMDAIDTWDHRQGKARYAEDIAQVLADATMDTLRRIRNEFDMGQAVEAALPRLEREIRDALTAPSTRLLETGMTTTSAPGVVAWEEKAKLKNDSREYDECIPERSPRQLRFDEVVPIPDNDGKLAEGGGHHHQAQREPDRFRPLASRLPGGGLLRLKSCTYDTIFRARPPP